MAFGGNLEDLPFADIIQLLHVSKKSGTLAISGRTGTARILCRDGFITDACYPGNAVNISQLLLDAGLITDQQLAASKAKYLPFQLEGAQLILSLIEAGQLSRDTGLEKLKSLIHQTLAEVITWKEGDFSFEPDEHGGEPNADGLSFDMAPWIGIDTQGALMDAFRVFDEKNRSIEEQKERKKERIKEAVARISTMPEPRSSRLGHLLASSDATQSREAMLSELESGERDLLSTFEEMDEDTLAQVLAPPTHVLILSDDAFLKHSMHRLCRDNGILLTVSELELDLREAFTLGVADGHSMALLVDLGDGPFDRLACQRRLSIAERLKLENPELPLVFSGDIGRTEDCLRLFELGARTVLPRSVKRAEDPGGNIETFKNFNSLVLGCLKSIFREQHQLRLAVQESRCQMAALKKRVQEIQDRESSLDVSIIILQYVAELLQRGIIFLVRKNDLLGLGSFGLSSNGDTISTAAMRIRIPLEVQSVFSDVVQKGLVHHGAREDEVLTNYLYGHIGAPASADFLVLPLKTENRTIALVYGDFGEKPATPPIKTDALEILASQAGMAMELALQRSRQERKPSASH